MPSTFHFISWKIEFEISGRGERQKSEGQRAKRGFYPKITVDWEKLGMAGAQTSVDSNAPPYAGSHRLISSRPMPTGVGPHNGVVMDNGPTTTNGSPVYEEVWRYLIGS